MDRLNHVIEAIRQSHHLPWVIAFFVGIVMVRNVSATDVDIMGDNMPTTLIDGMGR